MRVNFGGRRGSLVFVWYVLIIHGFSGSDTEVGGLPPGGRAAGGTIGLASVASGRLRRFRCVSGHVSPTFVRPGLGLSSAESEGYRRRIFLRSMGGLYEYPRKLRLLPRAPAHRPLKNLTITHQSPSVRPGHSRGRCGQSLHLLFSSTRSGPPTVQMAV